MKIKLDKELLIKAALTLGDAGPYSCVHEKTVETPATHGHWKVLCAKCATYTTMGDDAVVIRALILMALTEGGLDGWTLDSSTG